MDLYKEIGEMWGDLYSPNTMRILEDIDNCVISRENLLRK